MNRQKILVTCVLIVIAISVTTLAISTSESSHVYTPSDITKANPNLTMGNGLFSMIDDIAYVKDDVVLSLSGTVLSVGDPVDWTDHETGHAMGDVPVTIQIDEKGKNEELHLKLDKGDEFTFHLGGIYERGQYHIWNFQPQFEIDEKVIVHLGKDDLLGPNVGEDNYHVAIGKFGKYKIIEGKAYNEKHPFGKSVTGALYETLWFSWFPF